MVFGAIGSSQILYTILILVVVVVVVVVVEKPTCLSVHLKGCCLTFLINNYTFSIGQCSTVLRPTLGKYLTFTHHPGWKSSPREADVISFAQVN